MTHRLREILHAAILAAPIGCGGSSDLRLPAPADGAAPDAALADASTRRYVDRTTRPGEYCPASEPAFHVECFDYVQDDSRRYLLDRETDCPTNHADFICLDLDLTREQRKTRPAACCYREAGDKGRALVDRGVAVVARVRGVPRDRRARHWLHAGLGEQASIPSFLRAAAELRAANAPSSLVDGCLAGARDEARHAAACFRLASRYAGRRLRPDRLPRFAPRPGGREMIARTTFVEAAVPETIAVLRAQRELAAATDPEERDVLAMIVADETRHAALAWQTLAWARPTSLPALRRRPARVWREVIDPLLAIV